MRPDRTVLAIGWILCLGSSSGASGRHKRELRFPKGGSFVAAVALASFLPKGPTDGLAHVLEFDLGFPFPEHFSIEKRNAQKKAWKNPSKRIKTEVRHRSKPTKRTRRKRNLKEEQKKNLLLKVEDAITRIGYSGSSCILRLQCELQSLSADKSLLEHLLFALLRSSNQPGEEECEGHARACPVSILHVIMHSEQISSSHVV